MNRKEGVNWLCILSIFGVWSVSISLYFIGHFVTHNDTKYINESKFTIFFNLTGNVMEYYNTCNVSDMLNECQGKCNNKYSHVGEIYFSYHVLKDHYRYTSNMYDADIILFPIFLSLGINKYCGQRNINEYKKINNMLFKYLTILTKNNVFNNKKIIIIAEEFWFFSCWYKDNNYIEFINKMSNNSHNIIFKMGVMERMCYIKPDCFLNDAKYTFTVPYTIPFSFKDYAMYTNAVYNVNRFTNKLYDIFFMGSACFPSRKGAYQERQLLMTYVKQLNNDHGLSSFGVATDMDNEHKNCGIIDSKTIDMCDYNDMRYPCGLNGINNTLYKYGLSNSQFNIAICGDTNSTGKIYDGIAFGLINIFIGINKDNMKWFLPFYKTIPYHKFSFFIDINEFKTNGSMILKDIILNTPKETIDYMIKNVTYYQKYLLYNHHESLVVDNVLDI